LFPTVSFEIQAGSEGFPSSVVLMSSGILELEGAVDTAVGAEASVALFELCLSNEMNDAADGWI
jgi:hypothetical protein